MESVSPTMMSSILGIAVGACMDEIFSPLSSCSVIASAHCANISTEGSTSVLGDFMPIKMPRTVEGRRLMNNSTKMRSFGPLYRELICDKSWDGRRFPSST